MIKPTKVLIISDIHFRSIEEEDTNNAGHESIFTNGPSLVDDLLTCLRNENIEIDSIIFNGDIAYKGDEKEYELFHKKILLKLYEGLEKPAVFLTAGNHDVIFDENRDKFNTFNNFEDFKASYKNKGLFLIKNISKLRFKFTHYESYWGKKIFRLNDNIHSKFKKYNFIYHKENELTNPELINESFSEKGYFGLVVDQQNKIAYFPLNSSFFSHGPSLKDFAKKIAKGFEKKTEPEQRSMDKVREIEDNNLLSIMELISDFGNQSLATSLMKYDNDNYGYITEVKHLQDLGYRIVSFFHHNPSWLNDNERFNRDPGNGQKIFLDELVNLSDVLITSHEHDNSASKLNKIGNCHHIKTGMFLPDKIKKNLNINTDFQKIFPQSTFSILTIFDGKITEERFKYSIDTSDNRKFWKKVETNEGEIEKIDFRIKEIHDNVINEILVNVDSVKAEKYLYSKYKITEDNSPISLSSYEINDKPSGILSSFISKDRIILFCDINISIDDNFSKFRKLLNSNKSVKKILFCIPTQYFKDSIDTDLKNEPRTESESIRKSLEVREKWNLYAENWFDKFKTYFFSKDENSFSDKAFVLCPIGPKDFSLYFLSLD